MPDNVLSRHLLLRESNFLAGTPFVKPLPALFQVHPEAEDKGARAGSDTHLLFAGSQTGRHTALRGKLLEGRSLNAEGRIIHPSDF